MTDGLAPAKKNFSTRLHFKCKPLPLERKQAKPSAMSLDISILPAKDREELAQLFTKKLLDASRDKQDLEQQLGEITARLNAVNQDFLAYEKLVRELTGSTFELGTLPVSISSDDKKDVGSPSDELSTYSPSMTHAEKILFVLSNPAKYGRATFLGSSSVVEAIIQEEPSLTKESLSNIGPTISRLIERSLVVKALEKGSKSKFHFIDASWVDDQGRAKTEYKEAVKGLELLIDIKKLAAARTAAKTEAETNKREPSKDAVRKEGGGPMSSLPIFQS